MILSPGLAVAVAQASTSYELRWQRAPGAEACVEARELGTAVGARVGREVFADAGGAALVIDGEVRPTVDGWHVAIAVHDRAGAARGGRELDVAGADCRAIDEPLTLVLALIVDPEGTWGAPTPPVERAATDPSARRSPWRIDAAVLGAAGLEVLPGADVGARLAVTLDPPAWWPIALTVGWWAPTEQPVGGAAGGVRIGRWQAGAAVCTPAWRRGRAGLAGCAGGAVARVAAGGVGFVDDQRASALAGLATVTGRATVELRRSAFALLEVGAEVAVVRPRFVDDAGTTVYRVAPAAAVAALGVGVRF
jgi:hypothetical protein